MKQDKGEHRKVEVGETAKCICAKERGVPSLHAGTCPLSDEVEREVTPQPQPKCPTCRSDTRSVEMPVQPRDYHTWDYCSDAWHREVTPQPASQHLERWKKVCESKLFQFLKHGEGRVYLSLLRREEISIGKFAESVVEKFELGIEPVLPEVGVESAPVASPQEVEVQRALRVIAGWFGYADEAEGKTPDELGRYMYERERQANLDMMVRIRQMTEERLSSPAQGEQAPLQVARLVKAARNYRLGIGLYEQTSKALDDALSAFSEVEGEQAPPFGLRQRNVGSTVHAPGCECGFCKLGDTKQ